MIFFQPSTCDDNKGSTRRVAIHGAARFCVQKAAPRVDSRRRSLRELARSRRRFHKAGRFQACARLAPPGCMPPTGPLRWRVVHGVNQAHSPNQICSNRIQFQELPSLVCTIQTYLSISLNSSVSNLLGTCKARTFVNGFHLPGGESAAQYFRCHLAPL